MKPLQIEKQLASKNRLQALEEEEVIAKPNQAKEGSLVKEENRDNDNQKQNINRQKEETHANLPIFEEPEPPDQLPPGIIELTKLCLHGSTLKQKLVFTCLIIKIHF